jgi:hypothetical protein
MLKYTPITPLWFCLLRADRFILDLEGTPGQRLGCRNMIGHTDERAIYHIRIRGHLDESWSDNLSGMRITPAPEKEGTRETLLSGELADQAALMGVLNTLYDMGFSLISVELD